MIEDNPYVAIYNEDAKRDKLSIRLMESEKEKVTWIKSHANDKRVAKLVNGLVDTIYYPDGDVDHSYKGVDPNTNVMYKWNKAKFEDLISIRDKIQESLDKYQDMIDDLDDDIRAYGGMADIVP